MRKLTPDEAIARLLLQNGAKKAKGTPKKIELFSTIGYADEALYIVGNEDGSIAIPAYDGIRDVLGAWSSADGDIPPNMEQWLTTYAMEIEWWQNVGESLEQETGADITTSRKSVATMLKTSWSQGTPYNNLLVFDGKKCVTGCNTTATAQILKYWFDKGFHRGCKATQEYTTKRNGYLVPALPPTMVFDWKHLVAKPTTDEEKKAVAEMMRQISYAFGSDFTPNSTTANPKNVAKIMRDSLNMGNTIEYIHCSKLGAAKFEQKIYNEMVAKRPVMLAGWTDAGAGHSFVVDGYDAATDRYHINWGWNKYNGWFAMSALNATAAKAFNSSKVAIVGIDPKYKLGDVNNNGDIDITDVMQVVQDANHGKYSPQADINSDGEVTVTDAQLIINHVLGISCL